MKILIVGNADSIFIKSLIEKTMLCYHDNVSILSFKNSIYRSFYKENKVKVYRDLSRGGKLRSFMCGVYNIRTLKKRYDIISFHYIDSHVLKMIPAAKLYCKRVMLTYWGSDLMREADNDPKRRILGKMMLPLVDGISLVSDSLLKKFYEVYGNSFDNKLHIVDFGSENIDNMAAADLDENALKAKYDIDNDAVTVAIGYNKTPEQHHLEILEKISLLPEEVRKRIHLLLRLTYGSGSKDYVDEIKCMAENTGCAATFFEARLTPEQIAEITKLTDIFIHAQTTDALSASLCEHLYAGSLVFNPSWIRYAELENKAFFLTYKDFEECIKLLSENIVNKSDSKYSDKLKHNKEVIFSICSWKTHTPEWRRMYHDILKISHQARNNSRRIE